MKIAASQIQLASTYARTQRSEVSERLETWSARPAADNSANPSAGRGRNAPPGPPPGVQVALSQEGRSAQQVEAVREPDDKDVLDPRMRVLAQVIESITGQRVRLFNPRELTGSGAPNPDLADPASAAAPAERGRTQGAGLEYERTTHYEEHQSLQFRAEGMVKTEDGRAIRFTLGFEMSRSYMESSKVSVQLGEARLKDPLVLDFGGQGASVSDLSFEFDLDADGKTEAVPLLSGGRGFLAFDRNANGRIDDGSELFGPRSGNGFSELAALDGDGNGWIDENDSAFSRLMVWQPGADGQGQPQGLLEANVGALFVGQVETPFELKDSQNALQGLVRASGVYLREDGSAGTLSQVDLKV